MDKNVIERRQGGRPYSLVYLVFRTQEQEVNFLEESVTTIVYGKHRFWSAELECKNQFLYKSICNNL